MSYEMIAILMFSTMMLMMMTGQRVFGAIGFVAVVAALLLWGNGATNMGFSATIKLMKWYPLLTLPMFIFMGYVLSESRLADDLYKMFHVWFGTVPGGLAIGTIGLMVIISAMNGLSVAGMAIGATIALPELLRRNYDKLMVTGVIQAGSSLGILVPPSVVLVLYAMIARQPVGQLWLAGVFPGLMMAALFILYIWLRCKISPELGPVLPQDERDYYRTAPKEPAHIYFLVIFLIVATLAYVFNPFVVEVDGRYPKGSLRISALILLGAAVLATLMARALKGWTFEIMLSQKNHLLFAGVLPVGIFLVMMVPFVTGYTSLVESSVVGTLAAVGAAVFKGRMTRKVFEEATRQTLAISCMFMWIILAALAFGAVFDGLGAVKAIEGLFVDKLGLGPWEILILMQLSYLVMGTFLDDTAMLVIVAPLYVPLVRALGFDLIWYGVLYTITCQIAYMTPPFGYNLFLMRAMAPKEITIYDIYRSIIPFVGVMILALMLVIAFPEIALWLPNHVYGK